MSRSSLVMNLRLKPSLTLLQQLKGPNVPSLHWGSWPELSQSDVKV